MSEELDIRSLSVTDAAKLLKMQAETIRSHIRRGLPLVDGQIDLIAYGAWLNQQEEQKKAADSGASPQDGA
jgi:DeoR/GlpR family transcriptional regulator of sugar metabolism